MSATGTFRMAGLTFRTSALQSGEGKRDDRAWPDQAPSASITSTSTPTLTIGTVKPLWIGDRRLRRVRSQPAWTFTPTLRSTSPTAPGQTGKATTTWASPTNFGGSDFIFFEDNVYTATVDGPCRIGDVFSAGRTVWRFNTIQGCSGLEVHATGHSPDDRGARASEGYGNRFTVLPGQVNPPYDMADVSSGAMLLWGNITEPENLKNIFIFNVTRKNADTYAPAGTPIGLRLLRHGL